MKFTKRETGTSSGSQQNLFLKLKDGESVVGVLRGSVYEFRSKWVAGKSIIVDKQDPEGRSRFRVNIVVQEDGHLLVKIWEFGIGVNNKLADIASLLADVDRDITQTKIKIERRGTEMATEYHITTLAKEPLTKAQLENIAAIKLNLLEHQEKKRDDDLAPPAYLDEPPIDEDLPF